MLLQSTMKTAVYRVHEFTAIVITTSIRAFQVLPEQYYQLTILVLYFC